MEEAAEVQLVVGLCWIIQIMSERKLPYIQTNTNFFLKKIYQIYAKPLSVWNSETRLMYVTMLEAGDGISSPHLCLFTSA